MNKLIAALTAATFGAMLVPAAPAVASEPAIASVRESFAATLDGPAPAAPGVTNFQYWDAAAPYIRSGRLTTTDPDNAQGGAYRIARLQSNVTRVGASFAFSPYTKPGGVLCLSIQATSITEGRGVPVSPMHLGVGPEGWSLDVNTDAGTDVETLARGTFTDPLTADGATLHRVEVELDRATASVRLTLPDGSVRTLHDQAFGLPGTYVYVEPFKSPRDNGVVADQTSALVSEWWADSLPVAVAGPQPAEQPAATPTPVTEQAVNGTVEVAAPSAVAPTAPRKVRAEQTGKRIKVTWHGAAETYRVKCGPRAKTTDENRATVRASVNKCKVRSLTDGQTSAWSVAKVKQQ